MENKKNPVGRPKRSSVSSKAKGNRKSVGRPKGDAAIINEYKARMLNSPRSRAVMDAIWSLPTEGRAMIVAEQNVTLLSGRVDRMIGMHAGRMRGEVGHVALN